MKKFLILTSIITALSIIITFTACSKQNQNQNSQMPENLSGISNENSLSGENKAEKNKILSKARSAVKAFENNDYKAFISYVEKSNRPLFESDIFTKDRLNELSPNIHGDETSAAVEKSGNNYLCNLEYKYIISNGKIAYTIKYIFSFDQKFNLLDFSVIKTPYISNQISKKIETRSMKINTPCGKMNLAVTRPANADKNTPLIIMAGPFTQNAMFYLNGSYDFATFENIALKLAENGIACLRFASPDDYYKRMNEDQLNKSYTDLIYSNIKAVADFILKADNYDKNNIYILSLSTGSFASLDLLNEYDGIKAAILLSPHYDSFSKIIYDESLYMYGKNKNEYKQTYENIISGKMQSGVSYFNYGKNFWQEMNKKSFKKQIEKSTKPILILAAENALHISKNENASISLLAKNNKNIDYEIIEDVNENFIKTNDKYNIIYEGVYKKIVDFIIKQK